MSDQSTHKESSKAYGVALLAFAYVFAIAVAVGVGYAFRAHHPLVSEEGGLGTPLPPIQAYDLAAHRPGTVSTR